MSALSSPATTTTTADLAAVKGRHQTAFTTAAPYLLRQLRSSHLNQGILSDPLRDHAARVGISAGETIPIVGSVVCRVEPEAPRAATMLGTPLHPVNPNSAGNAAAGQASSVSGRRDVDDSSPACLSFAGHLVLGLFIVAALVHTLDKAVFFAAPTRGLSDERPRAREAASNCSLVPTSSASPIRTAGIEGTAASDADRFPGRWRGSLRCAAAPAVGPG